MCKSIFQAVFAVIVMSAGFFSCEGQDFETTQSGVKYKYIEEGQGPSPKQGDLMVIHFMYATESGDTLFNSGKGPRPATMRYDSTMLGRTGSIEEVLNMLKEGDSIQAQVPVDAFFTTTFERPLPDTLNPEDNVNFYIRLVEVGNAEEYFSRMQKEQDDKDLQLIEKYIADNNLENVQTTESGLRYVIAEEGDGPDVERGDSVKIDYTGYLLDGTIFDSSIEENAKEGDVFMEGRTYEPLSFIYGRANFISGWNEGIGYLGGGDRAYLILPSKLAYGPARRGPKIAPNSVLVFELNVREVKKAETGSQTN